jgi:hypothetical protein
MHLILGQFEEIIYKVMYFKERFCLIQSNAPMSWFGGFFASKHKLISAAIFIPSF